MLVDKKHVSDRWLEAAVITDLESGQGIGFRKAAKKNRSLLSARDEEDRYVIALVRQFLGDFGRDQHQHLHRGESAVSTVSGTGENQSSSRWGIGLETITASDFLKMFCHKTTS